MKLQELQTPAILVREDIMERNLTAYQQQCTESGKQLCRELYPAVCE